MGINSWFRRNTYLAARSDANDSANLARPFSVSAAKGFAAQQASDRAAHATQLARTQQGCEAPVVRDVVLRQALLDWLYGRSAAWSREADGFPQYAMRVPRGKAAVCEQLARELEEAE